MPLRIIQAQCSFCPREISPWQDATLYRDDDGVLILVVSGPLAGCFEAQPQLMPA